MCRLVTPVSATQISICTGWLIDDSSTILTAGHCDFQTAFGTMVAHFNVPASSNNGSINVPSVANQYPIDPTSRISQDNGRGDE